MNKNESKYSQETSDIRVVMIINSFLKYQTKINLYYGNLNIGSIYSIIFCQFVYCKIIGILK